MGDLGSIPRLGRSPGEGKGYPFQDSGLENAMGCIVHGLQRVGHNRVIFTHSLTHSCYMKNAQDVPSNCFEWKRSLIRASAAPPSHPACQLLDSVNDFPGAVHDFKTPAFTGVLRGVVLHHALRDGTCHSHHFHVETPCNLGQGTRAPWG